MTSIRLTTVVTMMALLALAVGCGGVKAQAPTPTPEPQMVTVATPAPNRTPQLPIARIKSIKQSRSIDAASGPRLAINVDEVDFGDVPYNTVVAYSFNIKNVGSEEVTIGPAFIRVKEGC